MIVPKNEPYSRVVNDVPEFDSDDEDHAKQLFDVHKDEDQFLGRSLSTTTKTELIEINYAIRFYAAYEGKGISAPTAEIPITICQNPAAEKLSNHRYDKKPRGWLPLEAPTQHVYLPKSKEDEINYLPKVTPMAPPMITPTPNGNEATPKNKVVPMTDYEDMSTKKKLNDSDKHNFDNTAVAIGDQDGILVIEHDGYNTGDNIPQVPDKFEVIVCEDENSYYN